ncbi:MAG: hypothetical protein FGM15_05480 [Chthoniobacterales bacterium]|nr:hypothetical protein [Chthoniobacterales bacterium]
MATNKITSRPFATGPLSPMDAVVALYGEGQDETARAIVAALNRRIFEGAPPRPSNLLRRALGRFAFRLMNRTTTCETRTGPDGHPVAVYRNSILERSGHPYASTLLEPSRADTASFVEGAAPMNAVYMMLIPEIYKNAGTWDHIMLDAVQSRDVQWRLVWETRMTHDLASRRLRAGQAVRLKAAAAGTGLSMILVTERLLQEGYDPRLISVSITDREPGNIEKALRLINKLPAAGGHLALHTGSPHGIVLHIEDLLHASSKTAHDARFDVVTAMGILEYFPGFTLTTTEEHLGLEPPDGGPQAVDVVAALSAMTAAGGFLITNSFRTCSAIRTMEVFGKRFRYRAREQMQDLLATGGFAPTGRAESGNIFDVEVFEKKNDV